MRKWHTEPPSHGMQTVTLESWKDFHEYIVSEFQDSHRYVFRGHRRDDWLLESTFDRMVKAYHPNASKEEINNTVERHYNDFLYAIRGRRGNHPREVKGDYVWALGQHYGLATPLLDWTTSPFVAAYFAFADNGEATSHRIVYALAKNELEERSEPSHEKRIKSRLQFLSPYSDENTRLVNQGGLFVHMPIGTDLESWIRTYFQENESTVILKKFLIPDEGANDFVLSLARMNINHLTLFPDLLGSAQYCNMVLADRRYAHEMGRHLSPWARIHMHSRR